MAVTGSSNEEPVKAAAFYGSPLFGYPYTKPFRFSFFFQKKNKKLQNQLIPIIPLIFFFPVSHFYVISFVTVVHVEVVD